MKRLNFLYVTKTKVDLNQNFRRFLLGYDDKVIIKKLQENSHGWQKDGILLPKGGRPHPMPPQGYGPAHGYGPASWTNKQVEFMIYGLVTLYPRDIEYMA